MAGALQSWGGWVLDGGLDQVGRLVSLRRLSMERGCQESWQVGDRPLAGLSFRQKLQRLGLVKGAPGRNRGPLGPATGRKGRLDQPGLKRRLIADSWGGGKLCQLRTDSRHIINTVIWCQPRR